MIREPRLTLFDLAICLSDACDLVCPSLTNHHKRVAYIAWSIGTELGLDDEQQKDLVLAATMHDIGALSLDDRIETMNFETSDPHIHAEIGYSLLKGFKPTERIAQIIRYHHFLWNYGKSEVEVHSQILTAGCIIHLADRIAALIDNTNEVLGQAASIRKEIAEERDKIFQPKIFDAFIIRSYREYFWLDAVSPTIYRVLRRETRPKTLSLDIGQLHNLAALFARVIDFRSRFTATHSAGVAATAEALAGLIGFSKRERDYIKIAGLLHDLGKLAIPREVLEKPGKLTAAELDLIRTHTYHTYRILETLEDFDTINTWASFHHERLGGDGYPFHHTGDDLSLGSRIMCVADIFTAIAEDRPYRMGMSQEKVFTVLNTMARKKMIDSDIVDLLLKNFEPVNAQRLAAQSESIDFYLELSHTWSPESNK
jgi:HD-GYP domain-containing protein (c-di-GMP phosphodiesterase class II)